MALNNYEGQGHLVKVTKQLPSQGEEGGSNQYSALQCWLSNELATVLQFVCLWLR